MKIICKTIPNLFLVIQYKIFKRWSDTMDLKDLDNGINNNGVDLNYDLNLKMNWVAKVKFVHK